MYPPHTHHTRKIYLSMCLINAYAIKGMGQQRIAPPIPNFDITCRCVVSCMSLLFHWRTELFRP